MRWWFLRALACCYLAAFASLLFQVEGLIGPRGILPAQTLLDWVRLRTGVERYWLLPTLGWFGAGRGALLAMCAAGALLALAPLFRLAPVPVFAALWLLYLSLYGLGQQFLSFQWDALLLETGFLAIFLAPLGMRPPPRGEPPPPVVWLLRALLFRLMLSSGLVKLLSRDPTWADLSALTYHYWTQPLPTPVGWLAAQLPAWAQLASCATLFVVELCLPIAALGPRRARLAAFWPLVGLQALIALTGNYAFFNLLSVTLCLALLDDRSLPARLVPGSRNTVAFERRCIPAHCVARRLHSTAMRPPRVLRSGRLGVLVRHRTSGPGHSGRDLDAPAPREWPRAVVTPVAAILGLLAAFQMTATLGLGRFWPAPVRAIAQAAQPFALVNRYGLFAVMTTKRREIELEGSRDGEHWRRYAFRYKPGDLGRRPEFIAPHQPRLDWQMWFAALGSCDQSPWLQALEDRLLEGSPDVLSLLAGNPFPEGPPRVVRSRIYDYRPTDLSTLRREGRYWSRRLLGAFCPPVGPDADVASFGTSW